MEIDDRTQLTMLYENMYQLMISKDTDNLAKIISEEFALHHMTGMIQKKYEFLQAIRQTISCKKENGTWLMEKSVASVY